MLIKSGATYQILQIYHHAEVSVKCEV